VIINKEVEEKRPIQDLPDVQRAITGIEDHLGDQGRVLVRYSGTENKVRVMVEGVEQDKIKAYAQEIAAAFVEG
jgi:phosphoglucosamine mutase